MVDNPDLLQKLTPYRSTDSRTAILRGIKEYIAGLEMTFEGKLIRFKKVLETWADPEDTADYPRAVVYSPAPGVYDDSRLTSTLIDVSLPGAGPYVLQQVCELSLPAVIEVWTTDSVMRMGVTAAVEDAMNPVDWMGGFRLDLPHYFSARATVSAKTVDYQDIGEDVQRRWRRSVIQLETQMPVYRFVGKVPAMRPEFRAEVT